MKSGGRRSAAGARNRKQSSSSVALWRNGGAGAAGESGGGKYLSVIGLSANPGENRVAEAKKPINISILIEAAAGSANQKKRRSHGWRGPVMATGSKKRRRLAANG